MREQSHEEQAIEALRRIRHCVIRSEGMTRSEIVREVRAVAEDGLRLTKERRAKR